MITTLRSSRFAPFGVLGILAASSLLSCLWAGDAPARTGTPPYSFVANVADAAALEQVVMPPVDVARYLREDEEREPGPVRFAAPIPVQLTPQDSGSWDALPGGGRLWRLRVVSTGALSLNFAFIPFHLPPGATLHLYSADKSYVEGPFDASDNIPENELWTPVVRGDNVVVELFVPSDPKFEPELGIGFVNHSYRDFGSLSETAGCQGGCNNDVICSVGDPWRDEIRSVAVYQRSGSLACTGTLVNSWNVSPPAYFLTANHCGVNAGNDNTVVVYWNHQSPNCGDLGGGNFNQNQTGSTFRAARSQSDFTLIQLDADPDPSFNVHYAGWDASGFTPSRCTGIHHPCTAEKAISFNLDALTTTTYLQDASPGDGTHWRVDDWESGVTEPGSSGSGIWNEFHRVVGQLHGGFSSCGLPNERDWYGKFSVSWNTGGTADTRLRDWLDPPNTHSIVDGSDGGCAYTLISSGTTATATGTPRYYRFGQPDIYWGAVGVRPNLSDDWDIRFYDDFGAHPECVTTLRASSAAFSGADFVIGDYNHNPLGSEYAKVNRYSGIADAAVEWDSGQDQLAINGPRVERTTGSADVLEVWDVLLQAGTQYTFEFSFGGAAECKLLLFHNPAAANYWVPRSGNVFEATANTTYTAPATDWYGVVVVNDSGGLGGYSVRVSTCTTPIALTSGTSVFTPASLGYYSFNQQEFYWTAVGVRDPGSDWDIDVYQTGSGGSAPVCFSGPLAVSPGVGVADFVIGDFNSGQNPFGTYYARPYQYSGTGNARTEWDDGFEQLAVGSPPITRNTDTFDVLEVWDVFLEGGQQYDFFFERTGAADTKLLLFRSFNAVYWASRFSSEFETTALHTPYNAPASDWYGVVVVNDNGGTGQYRLGINVPATAVSEQAPGATPRVTALHPPVPNPASGSVEFGFELREAGSVTLEVLDVAGRVTAVLPSRIWGAGTWSTRWNTRDAAGKALPSGVYWVRLSVESRVVGRNRFTLLQ